MENKATTISTLEDLGERLNVPKGFFEKFEEHREISTFMEKITIQKRRGHFRTVYNLLDESYRNILSQIRDLLNKGYNPPEPVHGFIKGRSIFTNAKQHLGKAVVINIDIRNFFESIPINKVKDIFLSLGFCPEIADVLSKITCYNGVLATGFATSPVISNIICSDMDFELEILAKSACYTYTRYCDDITFSSSKESKLPRNNIEEILKNHDFLINDKKYFIQKKGGNQYVTGLTVCEKDRPRIPKKLKKRLRLESYYINKYGFGGYTERGKKRLLQGPYSISGRMSYIQKLEPNLVKYMQAHTGYSPF
ncbi:MAG: reverse transcriptase family protein [Candidatus Absconditabacterales bacterium]